MWHDFNICTAYTVTTAIHLAQSAYTVTMQSQHVKSAFTVIIHRQHSQTVRKIEQQHGGINDQGKYTDA